MIRLRGVVAAILLAAGETVRAQPPTTSDGVDALLRGDYARAVQILQPIAERSLRRDHTAEFFMATLYENGLGGVAGDITRACALYVRASVDDRGPFTAQAEMLLQRLRSSMTPDGFADCALLANIGLDPRFEPVSFTLGPRYWISWDLKGVTIARDGRETRHTPGYSVRNGVFLPIQHTELLAGPLRAMPRHFLELAWWQPIRPDEWTLIWHLYEVAGDELVNVTSHAVATTQGDPRDAAPVDVRRFAGVSVDEQGMVQWRVLSGPEAGAETIPTYAERVAAKERDTARRNADARVDWERDYDVTRTPVLSYIDADGCGRAFVYGRSRDRNEAITIRADHEALQLSTTPRTFDLASPPSGLDVAVHVFERAQRHWPFCSDVILRDGSMTALWKATRGTVTIEVSDPGTSGRHPAQYRVTIRIEGAEFIGATGGRVRQTQPIVLTALAGLVYG